MRLSGSVWRAGRAALGLAVCLSVRAQGPIVADDWPVRGVLNEGAPEWMELGVEWRVRGESRSNLLLTPDEPQNLALSRLRATFGGRPSENFRFLVQAQDSRAEVLRAGRDPLDLRQAWIETGGEVDGPFRVRLGRQVVALGRERLFGGRRWNNISPTWDAARLTLRRGGDEYEWLSMSQVRPDLDRFDKPFRDDGDGNVHGFYGNLRSLLRGASVEPYLFYSTRPRVGQVRDFGAGAGAWSGGFRLAGGVGGGWDYESEWVRQHGQAREIELRGEMFSAEVGRVWEVGGWQSRLYGEWEYASGDGDPNDARRTTFDNLFGARRQHRGFASVVGRRNIRALQAGCETAPRPDLQLRLDLHGFWVARRDDAFYATDGTIAVPAAEGGAQSSHAGNELDFTIVFSPKPWWELDAGVASFVSGAFVRESRGQRVTETLLYLSLTLRM